METQTLSLTEGNDLLQERIKEVFFSACDLDPAGRREHVQALCGSNQVLRRKVEQLLENDIADSLFDAEMPALNDERIGKRLGKYNLLERIGEGGMGVVYRGEDARLRRQVAVKFLGIRMAGDSLQRERFLREAQAAASIRHPSICTVYDIGEADGQPYLVTAYLPGDTLESANRDRRLSLSEAIDCAIQLAEGLQAAHANGIVHRDLKPSNVILTKRSDGGTQATIIDFGLAQVNWGDRLTQAGRLIGTANYICPQLLRGDTVSEQADIWSLGVMVYEMLTGRTPFDAENRERLFYLICNESPTPLNAVSPELPSEIGRIVGKALEKDADRRYRTMGEFLSDLRAWRRSYSAIELTSAADTEPRFVIEQKPASGSFWTRLALVAASAIVLTTASWFSWKQARPPVENPAASKRIAVLPFEDLSRGERDGQLSSLLGELLAARLAQMPKVQMMSSSAVHPLIGQGATHNEVSSQLQLDYLVTGFIERSGNTLWITANLVSTPGYTILASRRVVASWPDTPAKQDRLVDAVVREMESRLSPQTGSSQKTAEPSDLLGQLSTRSH